MEYKEVHLVTIYLPIVNIDIMLVLVNNIQTLMHMPCHLKPTADAVFPGQG